MNTGSQVDKDPNATDWPKGIDWTAYCAARNTTIDTSTWLITGQDSSLVETASSVVTGSLKTQVKLSGGTVGQRYRVTNRIATAAGGSDDRSFYVFIKER